MHASDIARFERRLYLFTFVRAVWFYLPVLVHHIVGELREVGAEQPHTVAMSTLVIFSIGMLVAEYPSGVFADWAGRKRALALSCVFNIAGASIYVLSSSLTALFAGTALFSLAALVLLYGLEEPPRPIVHDHYFGVLRASLAEVRHHRPVRAILLLGGFGSTFFIFLFWTMQSYLVEIGAPVEHNGAVVGTTALLSAMSLTALSWLARSRRRHGVATGVLLFAIPCALLVTAVAYRLGWLWLGAGVLILTAMGQVLFRNLSNVRLQALVPDAVRASLASLDSWLASLLYVPVFPLGGALLDAWGIDGGYVAIAVLVVLPSLPLYTRSWRYQVWQDDAAPPRLRDR